MDVQLAEVCMHVIRLEQLPQAAVFRLGMMLPEGEGLWCARLTALASCLHASSWRAAYLSSISDGEGVASAVPRVCSVRSQPAATGRCCVLEEQLSWTTQSSTLVSLDSFEHSSRHAALLL